MAAEPPSPPAPPVVSPRLAAAPVAAALPPLRLRTRRRREPPLQPRLVSAIVLGLGIAALAATARLLAPVAQSPALVAVLVGVAVLALYRPLPDAGLGAGTLFLPAAVRLGGVAGGGWVAGVATLLAELGAERALYPLPERRGVARHLEKAGGAVLAAIAGGLVWRLLAPRPLRADPDLLLAGLAAGAVHAAVLAGLRWGAHRLRDPTRFPPRQLATLLLDLAGWPIGGALAATAAESGGAVATALALALVVLAGEAARHHFARERLAHRTQRLRGVVAAPERLAPDSRAPGGLGAALAAALDRECREALPVEWFQLDIAAGPQAGRSWSRGSGVPLAEGEASPPPTPPALPGFHRRSAWTVVDRTLAADGISLGRLRLWCHPRRLDPHLLELFDALLPQLAVALQRTLLDHEAKSDPLTGVPVRRVLERRLIAAFEQAQEEGTAVAVVMCDIDHFKRINDTYGHAVGDRALVAVSRLLADGVCEVGLLCRYGGEEFTILLEGAGGHDALLVADELRQRLSILPFEVDGVAVPLALSAGVAGYPELFARGGEDLLELADEALYEAKRQGRDRCLLALGQGRFADTTGAVHGGGEQPVPKPPKIFA